MNRQNIAILVLLTFISALLTEAFLLILPDFPFLDILLDSVFFLLSFILFDRYLWRWLRIGNQPNIHGDWLGNLTSSYQDNSEIEPIKVRIVQRWLTTRIDFIAKYASSSSSAAIFFRDNTGQYVLAYIYFSKPYAGEEERVPYHIGLSVMRVVETARLSGYYHYMQTTEAGIEFTHGQVVFTRL